MDHRERVGLATGEATALAEFSRDKVPSKLGNDSVHSATP